MTRITKSRIFQYSMKSKINHIILLILIQGTIQVLWKVMNVADYTKKKLLPSSLAIIFLFIPPKKDTNSKIKRILKNFL